MKTKWFDLCVELACLYLFISSLVNAYVYHDMAGAIFGMSTCIALMLFKFMKYIGDRMP